MDLISIGGFIIGAVDLASQFIRDYKDASEWREQDLFIDNEWPLLAIEAGILPGRAADYEFLRLDKIPTAELSKRAEVVYALNKDKKIKYRLVANPWGTPNALVRKMP